MENIERKNKQKCDLVILTALPVEYNAVRSHLFEIEEITHPQGTVYEKGKFLDEDNNVLNIALVEIGAGNVGAAFETERAVQYFNPDYLFFIGIAGGLKDVNLCDVVAVTKVYGYESGKAKNKFQLRPNVGESSYSLIQRARAEARKADWLLRLEQSNSCLHPKVFVAPIAAGEKVVSSKKSTIYKFLCDTYSDALAVEMEGRGFLQATHGNKNINALIIRGISDLIESKSKTDKKGYQKIAAQTASAFAFQIFSKIKKSQKLYSDKQIQNTGKIRKIETGERISASDLFGRSKEIEILLKNLRCKSLAIVGIKGIGKSKLASAIFEQVCESKDTQFNTVYWKRFSYGQPLSFSEFGRCLIKDITNKDVDFDNLNTIEQIQLVSTEIDSNKCLCILDQFEAVIGRDNRTPNDQGFAQLLKRAREGFKKGRLLITAWEIPKDSAGVQFNFLSLRGLTQESSIMMLEKELYGKEYFDTLSDTETLFFISNMAQGHPLALQLISKNYSKEIIEEIKHDPALRAGTLEDVATKIVSHVYLRISSQVHLKRVLAAVCIFSKPIDLNAVTFVSETDKLIALQSLNELAQRNLISMLPSRLYDVHDLVREFVIGEFAKEDILDFHNKAAEFYINLSKFDNKYKKSINDVRHFLDAIDHLLLAGKGIEAGELFINEKLDEYLYGWSHLVELKRLYDLFENAILPEEMQCVFLGNKGLVLRDLSQYEQARSCYEQSLILSQKCKIKKEECRQLINLGDLFQYQGDHEQAIVFHQKAAKMLEELNDKKLEMRNWGCLGNVVDDQKCREEYYKKAVSLCQELNDKRNEGIWLGNIGNIYLDNENYDQAITYYDRAIELASETGDRRNESWWISIKGSTYKQLNRNDNAISCFSRAFSIAVDIKYIRCINKVISEVSDIFISKNGLSLIDSDELIKIFNISEEIFGNRQDITIGIHLIEASLFEEDNNFGAAIDKYTEIIQMHSDVPELFSKRGRCYRILAYSPDLAGTCLNLALEDFNKAINLNNNDDHCLMLRAGCYAQLGNFNEAINDYEKSVEINPNNTSAILGKMESELCTGKYNDVVTTYNYFNDIECEQFEKVIASAIVSMAISLSGREADDYLTPLLDFDIKLSRRSQWCTIEIDRLLNVLSEKNHKQIYLDKAKHINYLFHKHFID